MSNSIAPGSSADVNVRVTALTTNPNVPVTYKTIILKKNLVNGVNTLTQEMMSTTNTKYVIKYDYMLGEDITVPENCILEFDGGSISGNGTGKDTITGNNTGINAGLIKIFDLSINISGTWNICECYVEWFGFKTNNQSYDLSLYVNKANLFNCDIKLIRGIYYTQNVVTVNVGIIGQKKSLRQEGIDDVIPRIKRIITGNNQEVVRIGGGFDSDEHLTDLAHRRSGKLEGIMIQAEGYDGNVLYTGTSGLVIGNSRSLRIRNVWVEMYQPGMIDYPEATRIEAALNNDKTIEATFNRAIEFRGGCECSDFSNLQLNAIVGIYIKAGTGAIDVAKFDGFVMVGSQNGYAGVLDHNGMAEVAFSKFSINQFSFAYKCMAIAVGITIEEGRIEQSPVLVSNNTRLNTNFYFSCGENAPDTQESALKYAAAFSVFNVFPDVYSNGLYVKCARIKANLINLYGESGFFAPTDDRYVLSLHINNTQFKDSVIQLQNAFFGAGNCILEGLEISNFANFNLSGIVSASNLNYLLSNCIILPKNDTVQSIYSLYCGKMVTKNILETSYKAKINGTIGCLFYPDTQHNIGTTFRGYTTYDDNGVKKSDYVSFSVDCGGSITSINVPSYLTITYIGSDNVVSIQSTIQNEITIYLKIESWQDIDERFSI